MEFVELSKESVEVELSVVELTEVFVDVEFT